MLYNIHYPNEDIKKHKVHDVRYSPDLNKVFWNIDRLGLTLYFQIVEIGEEDAWVEEISCEKYNELTRTGRDIGNNFVHFNIGNNSINIGNNSNGYYSLLEY